jgi:general secretion pathway protein D
VRRSLASFCSLICLSLLAACARPAQNPGADLRTLPEKTEATAAVVPTGPLVAAGGARRTAVLGGPPPPGAAEPPIQPQPAVALSGAPANLTIEQMPLPAFINTVLGDTLHLNFEIDPRIAQHTELVTLRTGRALPPNEILALARTVLRDYGLEIVLSGNLARVVPNDALTAQTPSVIRGRSTVEIAQNMRPIFQYVPLTNVAATDMGSWLQNAFGTKVRVTPAPNALLLLGLPDDVEAALQAIRTLDQPRLAGRRSVRIEPAFWSASQLAERLADILRAEGYSVSTSVQNPGAVVILPLRPSNFLVVFAGDQKTLSHIEDWVRDLDRVSQVDPQKSVFYYGVRNTTAESLAAVLNSVLQGNYATRAAAIAAEAPAAGLPPGAQGQPAVQGGASVGAAASGPAPGTPPPGRIVTDPARNAIIFQGSAEEFGQLRPLIENLDQAPREAIIEATVAEVTLTDSDTLGVEWILNLGATPNEIIQNTGTGIGTTGFTFTILNRAGATRLMLNALASNNRVRVLSTPKLLARSGGEARIQVGAQVPIVTSQGTSSQLQQAGTSAILQSIQYRDTGVILTVKPTIYAGNQIDLEIKQEVSEAVQNNTSGLSTPVINNRTVSTQLSLQDGATVLLGGLIMENSSSTSAGIPGLKDIPGVGFLFGTQQVAKTRSELFVFITPYIVNSAEDAERLTEIFKNRYESQPQPASTLHW